MRCRSAKLAQLIVRHLLKTFAQLVEIEGFQLNLLHNVLNLCANSITVRSACFKIKRPEWQVAHYKQDLRYLNNRVALRSHGTTRVDPFACAPCEPSPRQTRSDVFESTQAVKSTRAD